MRTSTTDRAAPTRDQRGRMPRRVRGIVQIADVFTPLLNLFRSRRMAWNLIILICATTLMAIAFRQADEESQMLYLTVSVLFSIILPVIVVCESVGDSSCLPS